MIFFTNENIDITIRLVAAMFLGGLIGFERERVGKEAGIRTYSLVCLGSALVMVVSVEIHRIFQGTADVDPSRIAAQVVTGIGFIGAGAIIRSAEKIRGLTTAAGIWTAAGIGLACGVGLYVPAIVATVFGLFVLVVFSKIDKFFGGKDH